jgi:hypothetical protein
VSKNGKKIFEEIDWRIRVFDSLSFPTLILGPDRVIMNANQIFLEKYGSIDKIVGTKSSTIPRKPVLRIGAPFLWY